jgi:small subunit ribosomal protein S16
MTTRIRLRRMGSNKRPFFRVVVADQRSPRDGRFIENIGKYHPLDDPSVIEIDQDRALHWLRVGAQPSNQVRNLMNKIGIWDEFVKERPSAATGPAKERTSTPKLSKKAKQKAEAAASEPEQGAVQETPLVEPEPEVAPTEVAEPEVAATEVAAPEGATPEAAESEVAEADAAEAVEAVADASAEESPVEEAATEDAAPADEAPTSEADRPPAAQSSGTDDA